jgi:endonuclease YncB( thermonuclease family)
MRPTGGNISMRARRRALFALRPLGRLTAVARALLAGAALASSSAAAPQKTQGPALCTLAPFASGTVKAVVDGRTFVLDDGREVRLDGIEVPQPPLQVASTPHPIPLPAKAATGSAGPVPQTAGETRPDLVGAGGSHEAIGESAPDSAPAAAALRALLLDKDVVLKAAKPGTDRYGRMLADAFLPGDPGGEAERSATKTLLAQGLARISSHPGAAVCLAELRTAEDAARRAALGLWGDPRYFPRAAEDAAGISADRGRFTLVEGKVVSVRESGGTIYVNFGRRWSEDFTVTIAKRRERAFSAAGLEPRQLTGRRVRVRGWVEERGGPWIEASAPEQIEIVADK